MLTPVVSLPVPAVVGTADNDQMISMPRCVGKEV